MSDLTILNNTKLNHDNLTLSVVCSKNSNLESYDDTGVFVVPIACSDTPQSLEQTLYNLW